MSAGVEGPLPQRVFQRLDDRAFQSGEALAAELAVTRAAVWKAVEQLRELGVGLDAQTNKGYRLASGVSALSADVITEQLPRAVRERIEALLVEWTLESTNTRLLDSLPPAAGSEHDLDLGWREAPDGRSDGPGADPGAGRRRGRHGGRGRPAAPAGAARRGPDPGREPGRAGHRRHRGGVRRLAGGALVGPAPRCVDGPVRAKQSHATRGHGGSRCENKFAASLRRYLRCLRGRAAIPP